MVDYGYLALFGNFMPYLSTRLLNSDYWYKETITSEITIIYSGSFVTTHTIEDSAGLVFRCLKLHVLYYMLYSFCTVRTCKKDFILLV